MGVGEGDGEGEGDIFGEILLIFLVMVKLEDVGDLLFVMFVEELFFENGDDIVNDFLKGLVKDDDEEFIIEFGLFVVEVLMGEEFKVELEVDVVREVEEEVGLVICMGKGNLIGS